MADDWATNINLGIESANKARLHVADILNATDPHQQTFSPFHTHKAYNFVLPEILLSSPSRLQPFPGDLPAATPWPCHENLVRQGGEATHSTGVAKSR